MPPGAPQPPPGSGSDDGRIRVLAIITAIVVLLSAAVTVVVLAPWSDDDKAKVSDSTGSPNGPNSGGRSSGPGQATQPVRPGDSGVPTGAPSTPGATGPTATSASPSASPSADPAAQAGSLSGLLDRSGTSRQSVIDSVNNASSCTSLPAARTALTQAADTRNGLVGELDALKFDALPEAQGALQQLRIAWQESAAADNDYAAWADAQSVYGCGAGQGQKDAGDAASARATSAKQAFVQAWNPIAARYGLPTRTELAI